MLPPAGCRLLAAAKPLDVATKSATITSLVNDVHLFIELIMARTADPNRRDDILRAARAVFDERGYTQTRMAEIAAQAGVAPGTIYLYFDSKEAIVLALSDQFFARIAEATLPALDGDDLNEAIANAVRAGLHVAAEERDLLKLTHLDLGLKTLFKPSPAHRSYHQALAERIRSWQERGCMQGYDPLILADLITGLVERAAASCLFLAEGELSAYETTITRMLQQILG